MHTLKIEKRNDVQMKPSKSFPIIMSYQIEFTQKKGGNLKNVSPILLKNKGSSSLGKMKFPRELLLSFQWHLRRQIFVVSSTSKLKNKTCPRVEETAQNGKRQKPPLSRGQVYPTGLTFNSIRARQTPRPWKRTTTACTSNIGESSDSKSRR